ncbi:S1C family serine protease [Mycoplasma sp. P36-A1]|uniref:S1C family serine protease n=1 Tax=Mycoplasma sp. P36-A1 TaxID=3252900 RepID=UPI003C2EE1E3
MNNKQTKPLYIIVIVLVILFFINTIMIVQMYNGSTGSSTSTTSKSESITISDDTTELVKKVEDSVVTVALYQKNRLIGNGSGSIISSSNGDTRILTNHHVVDNGDGVEIKVLFSNGKEETATVVGSDSISDLALLKVKTDFKVQTLPIGDSGALQAGETVIAIGSPLDITFKGTVTKGIISGLDRQIETDSNNDGDPDYVMQVIQTDTTINPGNSGGPLINMAGQLVGVNTSKISMEGYEGMGFAIPANEATSIIEQLEKNGKVDRPTLGISYYSIANIPEYAYSEYGITDKMPDGAIIVAEVTKNSAAAKAGLKENDIIVKVNDKEITSTSIFTSALYATKTKEKLNLVVSRNGKEVNITVTL